MTTPTTKPVPSEDPRDLLFNAGKLDELINATGYKNDRFGRSVPTYITAIAELGFDAPIAFASGINADSSRVTVEYSGDRYFARPDATPFITTGVFNPAQWSLFNEDFPGSNVPQLDSYTLLRAYAGSSTFVYITGFLIALKPIGIAGNFVYDPSDTTSTDNGGTVIVGADGRRWIRQEVTFYRPEWFGAVGDGITLCDSAFAMLVPAAMGGEILLSARYKFNSQLVIDGNDLATLTIRGTGSYNLGSNSKSNNNCYLDFDSIPDGQAAFTIRKVRGLVLDNFFISHVNAANIGSAKTLHIHTLDNFKLSKINVESKQGQFGDGIVLGNIDGNDCVFAGTVENCKVTSGGGSSFSVRPLSTSVNFVNCYQLGGYFILDRVVYSKFTNCASEYATLFGYSINNSTGITFDTCGSEANGRGGFYCSGSTNVTFINPFGSANNTSNNAGVVGDLITLDGSVVENTGIFITTPTSINSVAATLGAIGTAGTNKNININGVVSSNLPKGIYTTQSIKEKSLIVTGDLPEMTFSAGLSGFVLGGSATCTGVFNRAGNNINFSMTITPTSTIDNTSGAGRAQLPFDISTHGGNCIASDGSGSPIGICAITGTGLIYFPAFGSKNAPITVSGAIVSKLV